MYMVLCEYLWGCRLPNKMILWKLWHFRAYSVQYSQNLPSKHIQYVCRISCFVKFRLFFMFRVEELACQVFTLTEVSLVTAADGGSACRADVSHSPSQLSAGRIFKHYLCLSLYHYCLKLPLRVPVVLSVQLKLKLLAKRLNFKIL